MPAPMTAEPSAVKPPPAWMRSAHMCAVTGPCGHEATLEDAATDRPDHWLCPICGLAWSVEPALASYLPRRIVCQDQLSLPSLSKSTIPSPQ
jgi:hypothetical protein